MRIRMLAVMCALAMGVLSACGSASDSDVAVSPTQSEPAPSISPSPSEAPLPTTTPEAAKLQTARLGSSVAKTADEKAAVAAWVQYWQATADTYADVEPSPQLEVARGNALDKVLDTLNRLKAKNHRNVGWIRLNVTKIKVTDDSAVIRDCADNFSFEVDETNHPVEAVTPHYELNGSLSKDGDDWLVTGFDADGADESCQG